MREEAGLLGDGTRMEPPHMHTGSFPLTHMQLGRQTSAVLYIFEDYPPSLQCSAGTAAEPLREQRGFQSRPMLSRISVVVSLQTQLSLMSPASYCLSVIFQGLVDVFFCFPAIILHDILPSTNIHPSLILFVIEKCI